MYWPTSAARVLTLPSPLGHDPILRTKPSRRGNVFGTISESSIGIWDVRPTVLQAVIIRSNDSLKRWGVNTDVFWASDGRSLIILTSTSHLIVYDLQPTTLPAYESAGSSSFPSGGGPGEGDVLMGWELQPRGVAFVMGGCKGILSQPQHLILTLQHPPSILSVPYPIPAQLLSPPGSHFPPLPLDGDTEEQIECDLWDLGKAKVWMDQHDRIPIPTAMSMTRTSGLPATYSLLTDDGRVHVMYLSNQMELFRAESNPSHYSPLPRHQASPIKQYSSLSTTKYTGQLVYPLPLQSVDDMRVLITGLSLVDEETDKDRPEAQRELKDKAIKVSVNGRLGYIAVGTESGLVHIIVLPPYPQPVRLSHTLDLKHSANLRLSPGSIQSLAWTSDGYSLAVGYEYGWAVWSMGGRLNGWGVASPDEGQSVDGFMHGAKSMFWAPGNLELFVLTQGDRDQLHVIPFAKSATTGQHSPDNTRYAFLQMDDRVLVYRGADQPDISVINPESDVWQHIKIPNVYIATNWPIRYASISSDGRFIAVAGRRGLTHYSAASGRWKLFANEREERAFTVRGGLLWFHHVLVAAVEVDKIYQIRLYSRDLDLSETNVLHAQNFPSPVLVMTLLDNSLLVYTTDSTLYHFLILPTKDAIRLHLCGSISFQGVVAVPSRVRAISWLIPEAQKHLGDPADDLIVATIIFLVDGRLVLLRPRRAGNEEVRYDLQVLADRIEAYWTHLHGVGTLENSLWGYDGSSMRVWLDALTIESSRVDSDNDEYESVKESINLRLDFYPLSILMDKGIIIGVDYEISTRSLPFVLFKIQTSTHLFLPQFLRYHLDSGHLRPALTFAANYQNIVYFAHSLEILLHSVLEEETEAARILTSSDVSSDIVPPRKGTLQLVVAFLDYFPESLEVVVGCARKTELERWSVLFNVVGRPRELYERCITAGSLRTAASYLLVLHTLEEADDAKDTVRLLKLAMDAKEFQLCKELLRFLHSIDDTGTALRAAIQEVGIDTNLQFDSQNGDTGAGEITEDHSVAITGLTSPEPLSSE